MNSNTKRKQQNETKSVSKQFIKIAKQLPFIENKREETTFCFYNEY